MANRMALIIALLICGLQPSIAEAADYVWTGAASADWNEPANWNSDLGVPGNDDDVVIGGLKKDATILLSQDSAVSSLTFYPGALHACSVEKHSLTPNLPD